MTRSHSSATLARLTEVDPSTIRVRESFDGLTIVTADLPSGRRAMAVMPSLRPGTPNRVRRLWLDRAEANLTGRCPRCDAVSGARPDGDGQMVHAVGCRVMDDSVLARWLLTGGQAP